MCVHHTAVPAAFLYITGNRVIYCYTVGWSDFEGKNATYILNVVPNCFWTPMPKFHVLMLPLSLVVRPVILKSTKKFFFQNLFEACDRG